MDNEKMSWDDWFDLVSVMLLPVIIIIFVHSCVKETKYKAEHPLYYEYVDTNGNTGETNRVCVTKGDIFIGMADMTCKLDDGTIIKVTSFKPLRKGE